MAKNLLSKFSTKISICSRLENIQGTVTRVLYSSDIEFLNSNLGGRAGGRIQVKILFIKKTLTFDTGIISIRVYRTVKKIFPVILRKKLNENNVIKAVIKKLLPK